LGSSQVGHHRGTIPPGPHETRALKLQTFEFINKEPASTSCRARQAKPRNRSRSERRAHMQKIIGREGKAPPAKGRILDWIAHQAAVLGRTAIGDPSAIQCLVAVLIRSGKAASNGAKEMSGSKNAHP